MIADVQLLTRGFEDVLPPAFELRPEVMSWRAMGGPEAATLRGRGDPLHVADALNWLRRPVVIRLAHETAWWGYVDAVTVWAGRYNIGASLEMMANRVSVAYSYVEPGTQEVGQRQTTDWAEDAESVSIYGTKALRLSVDGASPAQAEGARDTYLNQNKWPQAYVSLEDGPGEEEATIEVTCRGWWDTLGWIYYQNTNTLSRSVTNRLGDVVVAAEFIAGYIEDSVIATAASEYQDGDSTALVVIEELLRTGDSGNLLLATITPDRELSVRRQPQPSAANLQLTEAGLLTTAFGLPVVRNPAGQWCDANLGVLSMLAHVGRPSPFLIERADYRPGEDRWRVEPWGAPSAWNLVRT